MAVDSLTGGTAFSATFVAQATAAREAVRVRPESEPAEAIRDPQQDVEEADTKPREQASAVAEARRDFAESAVTGGATKLSIRYDEDIDVFISARIEPETGEVVRQFPYEEQLERIRLFKETNDSKLDVSA